MRSASGALLLIASLGAAALGAAATPFYVSPSGSDQNPGTLSAPFRTLRRAQAAVRAANEATGGDITVYLRSGVYHLTAPLEFGPADSGQGGGWVSYQAYRHERPVVSGGVRVTGWKRLHGRIYCARLDRTAKLRWLFIDGRRAEPAQSDQPVQALGPWGRYRIAGTEPWAETPGSTFAGIRFPASALPAGDDPADLELIQAHSFNELILCVRAVTREGADSVAVLQQPYGAIAASLPWKCGASPTGKFIVRNALALLRHPGQFYFDRPARRLYYFSRGEDMSRVEAIAPVSPGLIRIWGASTSARVQRLRFAGITFAYDDWLLKAVAGSRGFVGVQSLGLYVRYRADGNHHRDRYDCLDLPQAAVDLRNCASIEFERNRFEHLGSGCAVSLTNDAVDCRVEGNVFWDLAGNAVNVGHPQHYATTGPLFPPGTAGICERDQVRDNLVRRCCLDFVQEEAVSGFFTRQVTIAHNDIAGVPYGAIALGWWWGNAGIPPSTVPCGNRIVGNRVAGTQEVLGRDGGAIYVLGVQPGGRIERNYLRAGVRMIYPDDGSAGWTIDHNVVEDGTLWMHIWTPRIHDLVIRDNYTNRPAALDRGVRCPLLDTQVEPAAPPWSPAAQAIIDTAGLEPAYADLGSTLP